MARLGEGVYLGLDDDVGEADDGVLYTGGHAVAEDAAEHVAVEAYFVEADRIDAALFGEVHEAEDAAHGLSQGGGKGGRPDAPVEHADEQQVEHDVGERGEDEVMERAAAVAHGRS